MISDASHYVPALLDVADDLARRSSPGEAGGAARRRAISTAYYAAFQALCALFAEAILGGDDHLERTESLFRHIEHRDLDRLSRSSESTVKRIGEAFVDLRARRFRADYASPTYAPPLAEAENAIARAREIIGLLETLTMSERREVAVLLIAKRR